MSRSYPLPDFVAATLNQQLGAPREVAIGPIASAVLRGADCAIYVVSGVLFVGIGFVAFVSDPHKQGSGASPSQIGAALLVLGLLCLGLAAFRVWRVAPAIRGGDAHQAEVANAEVGPARIYGTPWGEPLFGGGMPIAARGTYRFIDTGDTGRYYMQQRWALALRPGDRMWVLRRAGRDVLYAPVGNER